MTDPRDGGFGDVEHVDRVCLPRTSRDVLEVKLENTVPKVTPEGSQFPNFLRLHLEIQDMVWKATLESRIVYAIGYSSETIAPTNDPAVDLITIRQWILLQARPLYAKYIPIFHVCRRSRIMTLSIYGSPFNGIASFHPDLDTLEISDLLEAESAESVKIGPFPPRNATPQGRFRYVKLEKSFSFATLELAWETDPAPVYVKGAPTRANYPYENSLRRWVVLKAPFKRAKNLVFYVGAWALHNVHYVFYWAISLVPNTESITIRVYVPEGDVLPGNRATLRKAVRRMVANCGVEGWSRLKTIDFERQRAPAHSLW